MSSEVKADYIYYCPCCGETYKCPCSYRDPENKSKFKFHPQEMECLSCGYIDGFDFWRDVGIMQLEEQGFTWKA